MQTAEELQQQINNIDLKGWRVHQVEEYYKSMILILTYQNAVVGETKIPTELIRIIGKPETLIEWMGLMIGQKIKPGLKVKELRISFKIPVNPGKIIVKKIPIPQRC